LVWELYSSKAFYSLLKLQNHCLEKIYNLVNEILRTYFYDLGLI